MSSRSLVAIAVLECLILVSILIALIILVTKTGAGNNVVCKSEHDTDVGSMNHGTSPDTALITVTTGRTDRLSVTTIPSTLSATDSGPTTDRLLVPECPLNPDSQNPDLDKAKCILESYPLIDG